MRSYYYNEGIWKSIEDPMPEKPDSYEDYAFKQALEKHGFSSSFGDKYHSQVGEVRIYSRDHKKLPGKRGQTGFPYDFMAVLYLGSTYIRVWIADLPNALLFMREIDAREKTSIEKFFEKDVMYDFMKSLEYAADQLTNGDTEITIKQPKAR